MNMADRARNKKPADITNVELLEDPYLIMQEYNWSLMETGRE